jgi:hypothetical protein
MAVEAGAMTKISGRLARSVMMSSASPPASLSQRGSSLILLNGRIAIEGVPVHGRETPICAYAAMGSWPI